MDHQMKVSISGLSFMEMSERRKLYIDKSMLIADILETDDRGVYLFTRPRRFGKSTNISMLDAFFNMEYAGNPWFDGLTISEHREYDKYRNAYPVINLNLSKVSTSDFDEFLGSMRTIMAQEFDRHECIFEDGFMRPVERNLYNSLADDTAPANKVASAPGVLGSMLERYHGRKVVVLIDEYDYAITRAFGTDLLQKIIGFMGDMMSSTLKDNPSLQMAYVTGVMQVAKAGIFSGANNLFVNNVFSVDSDERFGFTESEVRGILEYYGHPEKMDEVREWYDGYRFGNAKVYNPFSVMSYILNGFKVKAYWVNSGNDKPIRWMMDRTDRRSLDAVADIVSHQSAASDLHPDMSYEDMRRSNQADLYSFMVMTGYLKAIPRDDGMYDVSIPNNEVGTMVDKVLKDVVSVDDGMFREFAVATLDGDVGTMESLLTSLLGGSSYFDLKDESDYKLALFICLHGIIWRYDVECEMQKGNGRLDIILTPRDDSVKPIIMELKIAGSEDGLEREALDGIRQIHDRRYYHSMKGEVILYGISFWGVVPKVVMERLDLRGRPRVPDSCYGAMTPIEGLSPGLGRW